MNQAKDSPNYGGWWTVRVTGEVLNDVRGFSKLARASVPKKHVVFCPSGCAPSEWCLNSAWLWPAKRPPSCFHQLPAQAALIDSPFFSFFIRWPAFTQNHAHGQGDRLTDKHLDRQTWWECRYSLTDAHAITPPVTSLFFYTLKAASKLKATFSDSSFLFLF